MAYSTNLGQSARRHYRAAERLDGQDAKAHEHDRPVAGYLFGVAGECALKQLMRESGIRPKGIRREDPFYAHFPALKTMLRDRICGRHSEMLRRFVEDNALMNEWDTDMRYAPGSDVTARRVDRWRQDAKRLIDAMEGG